MENNLDLEQVRNGPFAPRHNNTNPLKWSDLSHHQARKAATALLNYVQKTQEQEKQLVAGPKYIWLIVATHLFSEDTIARPARMYLTLHQLYRKQNSFRQLLRHLSCMQTFETFALWSWRWNLFIHERPPIPIQKATCRKECYKSK
jgi:hypothetical protein